MLRQPIRNESHNCDRAGVLTGFQVRGELVHLGDELLMLSLVGG